MQYTFIELLELINNQQYVGIRLRIEKDHAVETNDHNYWLNDDEIKLLTEALDKQKTITELVIPEHFLTDIGAKYIANLTHLKKLDLSENNIGIKGAIDIATIHLEFLDLSYCNINFLETDDGKLAEKHFLELIINNTDLKTLKFREIVFRENVLNALINNSKVENLTVSHIDNIKIEDNDTLKELEIALSTITQEDLIMLNRLHNIEKLTFYYCNIIGDINILEHTEAIVINGEASNNEESDWS